jgi:quercetin dioxygenase-like cupin family protein
MSKSYTFHPPRGGQNYEWENDHIFIKVASEDSGGAYTVVEDNLKATFALGLHMHRTHAETFYILEGRLDFFVDGEWITADAGSCLHVPPGVPHACVVSSGVESARMLMIYQPAGFDGFLAAIAQMTEADFARPGAMAALEEKYDLVQLGPVPERA